MDDNIQPQLSDSLKKSLAMPHMKPGATATVTKMDIIAENLVEMAVSGDEKVQLSAIKEIADRIDGKARQVTDITTNGKDLPIPIVFIPDDRE